MVWVLLIFIIASASSETNTSCEKVLNFYNTADLYKVQDCVEVTQETVMWRIDTPLTWQNSRFACRVIQSTLGYKGDLVSVHNFKEFQAAMNLHLARPGGPAIHRQSWNGLTGESGTWKWCDGTALDYNKLWAQDIVPFTAMKRGMFMQYRGIIDVFGEQKVSAVKASRETGEAFVVSLFEDAQAAAVHANRITVMPKDVALVQKIKGVIQKYETRPEKLKATAEKTKETKKSKKPKDTTKKPRSRETDSNQEANQPKRSEPTNQEARETDSNS